MHMRDIAAEVYKLFNLEPARKIKPKYRVRHLGYCGCASCKKLFLATKKGELKNAKGAIWSGVPVLQHIPIDHSRYSGRRPRVIRGQSTNYLGEPRR